MPTSAMPMPPDAPFCSTCHWLDVEAGNLCKGKLPDLTHGSEKATWAEVENPEATKGCKHYRRGA